MEATEFDALYRRNFLPIAKFFARRAESSFAEDLAAETFSVAWNKKDQATTEFELAWLYKIAGYVLNNHRRKQLKEFHFFASFSPTTRFAPSAEQLALKDDELARAIAGLPTKDQAIIGLVYLDDLPVKVAAEILSLTPNAVSIRLTRIRAALALNLKASERFSDD